MNILRCYLWIGVSADSFFKNGGESKYLTKE
jgi:hypothetical protein